jgi:hypothetical protein
VRNKILRNSATSLRKALPSASRPLMPGYGIKGPKEGTGLLPWKWAQEHLEKAHNFWVASTRPDGRPHVMPVWAVWMEDALYFSTGAKSRKARNLRANPACVVCAEHARGQIVIEGTARGYPTANSGSASRGCTKRNMTSICPDIARNPCTWFARRLCSACGKKILWAAPRVGISGVGSQGSGVIKLTTSPRVDTAGGSWAFASRSQLGGEY